MTLAKKTASVIINFLYCLYLLINNKTFVLKTTHSLTHSRSLHERYEMKNVVEFIFERTWLWVDLRIHIERVYLLHNTISLTTKVILIVNRIDFETYVWARQFLIEGCDERRVL